MKLKAALSIALFLFAGCASQHQSDRSGNSAAPTFSGHPVNALGAESEQIWHKQLASARFGMKNKGIVRAVRDGSAEVSLDDGKTWKEAKVGTVLEEKSRLRTDANATADLFIGDNGPVVRLRKNTELRIVRLSLRNRGIEKDIDTMLELPKGKILGNVKKLSAESSYLIRTHGGIIQIRGTEFSAAADGSFSIEVGSGVVYAKGKVFQVQPGEAYTPSSATRNTRGR